MEEHYPFGNPIGPVIWSSPGKKQVVVIGVYPSAVHARWSLPTANGIAAVAVADEPHPFWTGEGADSIVEEIAQALPEEAGTLQAARGHNGVSGRGLDDLVLIPLGLTRDHIRLVDIHNRYMANKDQHAAVVRSYEPLAAQGLLPPVNWTLRHDITSVSPDRQPPLVDELNEADPAWVITLGNEPLRALSLDPLSIAEYGTVRTANILGRNLQLLPLAHTRQAGRHGAHSERWFEAHAAWMTSKALDSRTMLERDID